MGEVWADIPGIDGTYQVSDLGRVRSVPRTYTDKSGAYRTVRGKILTPKYKEDGHTQVDISSGIVHVHKLVLLAFQGVCPEGQVRLHLNGIPDDNRLVNLRYGTRGENIRMDFQAGVRSHRGAKNPKAKLSEDVVAAIRSSQAPTTELMSAYGVSRTSINDIRARVTWVHTHSTSNPAQTANQEKTQMAKSPSKIMTIADKKLAQANLKAALAQHNTSVKAINADQKAADAALAAAKKSADAIAKEAAKAAAAKAKEADALVKAAQKTYDAAVAKSAKAKDAAAKGTAKLTMQLVALDAAPVATAVPAPKAKKVAAAVDTATA